MDKENTLIQCINDGCTDEFANEKELLHHLFVGKCHFEIEFKSSANFIFEVFVLLDHSREEAGNLLHR
jgi:hypothetical protein